MSTDLQQISISGIPIGLIIIFLGSLLNFPLLYNLGIIIFSFSILILLVQWVATGGFAEFLNWIPMLIIISIIFTLGSDFVSQSDQTQLFTWPFILIVLIIVLTFFSSQGGDFSIIIPFIPVLIGLGLLGIVGGELLWQDPLRGIAYALGFLGITIMLIWMKIRTVQKKEPVTGDKLSIINKSGTAISDISPGKEGRVRIGGAIWKAISDHVIYENMEIIVQDLSETQLTVKVVPAK
ncbi:MAG: hypothetical protein EAX86_00735 [Candidatus Heimdallarchaeota archaeon]|nr:hypothetical protein [Candidatus Heimdallarchaeota archaeon]